MKKIDIPLLLCIILINFYILGPGIITSESQQVYVPPSIQPIQPIHHQQLNIPHYSPPRYANEIIESFIYFLIFVFVFLVVWHILTFNRHLNKWYAQTTINKENSFQYLMRCESEVNYVLTIVKGCKLQNFDQKKS